LGVREAWYVEGSAAVDCANLLLNQMTWMAVRLSASRARSGRVRPLLGMIRAAEYMRAGYAAGVGAVR